MTLALARPVKAERLLIGQVVMATDRYHSSTGRPHLVVGRRGNNYNLVEFSHTPQGEFETDELGGGSYLACIDFKSGKFNARMVNAADIRSYERQLSTGTRKAALAEAARCYSATR